MRNIRKFKKEIKGRTVTAQRELLLSLIRKAGRHISAKELYRRASSKNQSISLATVYRSLQLFKELGLVEERRLGQVHCYYEMKDLADHQHLVCRSCGKVIEFESPLLQELIDTVQRDHTFDLTKIEVYLEGYCQECDEDGANNTAVTPVLRRGRHQIEKRKTEESNSRMGKTYKEYTGK
jgi:Fe2+ or Zn2+ uptake regulation protein